MLQYFHNENLTNNITISDTKKSVNKLSTEILKNKENIRLHLELNFNDFLCNINENESIITRGENIIKEIKNLLEQVDNETKPQLILSENELNQIEEELGEIILGLKTTQKILKIDELFEHLEKAKTNNDTLLLMEIIGKLKSLIFDGNDKVLSRILCYQNIKIKYYAESEMLLHNLNRRFEELVQLKEICSKDTKIVSIKISNDKNELKNIIIGLFNAKYNPTKICNFLLHNIFEAIIKTSISLKFNENDNFDEYAELILSYKVEDAEFIGSSYKSVFKNILAVLKYFNRINISLSDNICVYEIFGKFMKNKFLELLINECLVHSIPDIFKEMEVSDFVKDILKFNKILVDFHLLNVDCDKQLVNFADNIIILAKNRFYENCIDEAIHIMKKDLYNTISVENINSEKYTFPKCMISKSMLELITLLNKVVEEKDEKSLNVVISIINHYTSEVPRYHEKMLNSIPQQTALFFNNSMFFSNWLISNFDDEEQEIQKLFHSLQNLASEYFTKQVEIQYNNLHGILSNFDLSDAVSELGTASQRTIRQCLRQLDLLKNVWQSILTNDLYDSTMLNLVDEFCKELIQNIMIIEDIPSIVSTELVDVIIVIEERLPRLFQEEHYIIQAKLWLKLMQLKLILGGSLSEIIELWSDGVGPLSLNFKAEEIKHLIRALFQNTERRANALALIT